MADFSLDACLRSVKFDVEQGLNPFEELGRSIIRNLQDPFFNETMITAWRKYILDNNIRWDTK